MTGLFEQQRSAMTTRVTSGPFDQSSTGSAGRSEERVNLEFERYERLCGGVLGVSAVHMDDGRRLGFREEESFPMASTFKVPLAVLVLQQIEAGLLDLTQMVEIGPDLRVPPPLIEAYFRHPGLAVSVANLLDIMLVTSDNGATDALLALVGGPAAVMAAVERAGIAGLRINRSTSAFLADFLAFDIATGESFAAAFAQLPLDEKARLYSLTERANDVYEDDARDSTSPSAMARLLALLWQGEELAPHRRTTLFETMRRCENDDRLKGLLPPGTRVAHKTGTLGGATSDVGIVELPYGAGAVAIAVYVKKSRVPTPQRERAIAHVARTAYDYMLLGSSATSKGSPRP